MKQVSSQKSHVEKVDVEIGENIFRKIFSGL